VLRGQAAIRRVSADVAGDQVYFGRQSGIVVAAVEHRDVVSATHRFVHAVEADLTSPADVEHAHTMRH
jgi:hypothetical protein